VLILRHREVRDLLAGREREVLRAVRTAYVLHDEGSSTLPHSTFLRLPRAPGDSRPPNRIIGLPAHLGGAYATVGLKWVASFPGNLGRGLDRASAVIVLNSIETGRPEAVIEASLISAARTGASAAIAADLLVPPGLAAGRGIAIIGGGVINLAVLRYLRLVCPTRAAVVLYDRDPERGSAFVRRCAGVVPGMAVRLADDLGSAVAAHDLISIATTASTPHMDLTAAPEGATVLHVSLRDLVPQSILDNHNVTDDADHVCREGTSLHLAEQATGDRGFIDASLGELLRTGKRLTRDPGKAAIFSPFGLGVLDLAVARLVADAATREGRGLYIDAFLPDEHRPDRLTSSVTAGNRYKEVDSQRLLSALD
jgi:ornithine cyclodeaminase